MVVISGRSLVLVLLILTSFWEVSHGKGSDPVLSTSGAYIDGPFDIEIPIPDIVPDVPSEYIVGGFPFIGVSPSPPYAYLSWDSPPPPPRQSPPPPPPRQSPPPPSPPPPPRQSPPPPPSTDSFFIPPFLVAPIDPPVIIPPLLPGIPSITNPTPLSPVIKSPPPPSQCKPSPPDQSAKQSPPPPAKQPPPPPPPVKAPSPAPPPVKTPSPSPSPAKKPPPPPPWAPSPSPERQPTPPPAKGPSPSPPPPSKKPPPPAPPPSIAMAPSPSPAAQPPVILAPFPSSPLAKPPLIPRRPVKPVLPPSLPPAKTLTVNGLVYCKPCKSYGVPTLLNASQLQGASVRLVCYNGKNAIVQSAITDKNGEFRIMPKSLIGADIDKCKVYLVKSPNPTCNVPTNFNGGKTGALLQHIVPPNPSIVTPAVVVPVQPPMSDLYGVGPFIFEASSKMPCAMHKKL